TAVARLTCPSKSEGTRRRLSIAGLALTQMITQLCPPARGPARLYLRSRNLPHRLDRRRKRPPQVYIVARREGGLHRKGEGVLQLRAEIDLRDAALDRTSEQVVADARASVEHERGVAD